MSLRAPLVAIPTCYREHNERLMYTAVVRYPHAVVDAAGCMPILVPSIGDKLCCDTLLDAIHGLLLPAAPPMSSRIITKARRAARARCTTPTAMPPRAADSRGGGPRPAGAGHLPGYPGIERGAGRYAAPADWRAAGGEVHRRGRDVKRIMEMTMDERYGPCHPVDAGAGRPFRQLAGTTEIMVNSLHGQGSISPPRGFGSRQRAPDGSSRR